MDGWAPDMMEATMDESEGAEGEEEEEELGQVRIKGAPLGQISVSICKTVFGKINNYRYLN